MRITKEKIVSFEKHLLHEEKAFSTVEKYVRDVSVFVQWLVERDLDKEKVLQYKEFLCGRFSPSSVNSVLSSLNSFFHFCDWHELKVKALKVQRQIFLMEEKEITKAEYERLLVVAKEKNNERLYLLMSTICSTGIRVSECVGLNLDDIDLEACGARVYRKGGKEAIVYFSDEVRDTLEAYIQERKETEALPGHEEALFLSLQKKRLSVRSVENLVKKYSRLITPLKKITPHKLRSTYGTNLYKETGDIYLVASVLGHSDVNTTRKHYAAQEDERRRSARNIVKLREP